MKSNDTDLIFSLDEGDHSMMAASSPPVYALPLLAQTQALTLPVWLSSYGDEMTCMQGYYGQGIQAYMSERQASDKPLK